MTRFLILAEAASYQGSDTHTCTGDHVCCIGVGKLTDLVGMFTAPDTDRVIIRLIESIAMVTVDQAFKGRV